jgi:hypothetical protein
VGEYFMSLNNQHVKNVIVCYNACKRLCNWPS